MSFSYSSFFGPRHYEPPPFHHICWDPFQDPGFGQALTTTMFHLPFPNYTPPIAVSNQIEWKETPEAHVYKAHLPGLNHNDVKVEVDDGRLLCISGEKKVEKEEHRGRWHHVERARGKFLQSLMLPENSKVDHVKAYMDNGVLTVNVPKKNQDVNNRHARIRNINISGR